MDTIKNDNNNKPQQEIASEMDSSLGAWTVVSDTIRTNPLATDEKNDNEENNKVETLDQLDVPDVRYQETETVDDLSDGISIISESESAGRFSPNPILRQTLSNLSFKYPLNEPNSSIQSSVDNLFEPVSLPIKLGKTRESFSQTSQQSLIAHTDNDEFLPDTIENSPSLITHVPYFRSGFTGGLFYVIAILALIAFIAKIKYPEWELLSINSQIEPLMQRVQNLELQNNLLRAEIDILTKQVHFLSSQSQQRQQFKKDKNIYNNEEEMLNKKKYEVKIKNPAVHNRNNVKSNQNPDPNKVTGKSKTIKVWPGEGNNLQDVQIPPSALKNPYTRPCDEKEEEIAGFCVSISKESFGDENIDGNENSDDSQIAEIIERFKTVKETVKRKYEKVDSKENKDERQPDRDNSKSNSNYENNKKNEKSKYKKNKNEFDYEKNRKDDKFKHNEEKLQFNFEHNKSENNPKYIENKENDKHSKKFNNELHKKYNSKEDSKENQDKFKDYDKFKNDDSHRNSDWHENMMKHRENSRKTKDGVEQDNWYMKRANSRKEARVIDNNNYTKMHKNKRRNN